MITDKTALKYAKALKGYVKSRCVYIKCSKCKLNPNNGLCTDIINLVISLEAPNEKG